VCVFEENKTIVIELLELNYIVYMIYNVCISSTLYFRSKKFMCRYLFCLFNKLLRFFKFFFTKLTYSIFIFKQWNYRLIIMYMILVSFSTVVLVYNQPRNDILQDLISDNEIIQVNIFFMYLFFYLNKYLF
jgi:hypothetical protein